ncbi:hypothetical protein [Flammeovirga agarivorans]|uniref:Outer membrane protein beta-barrel domain-containing protein n=1 Tax=Flammeovirga agarivorans TaxID=2726742 RepID=A0A7X8SKA5_9BACT|nr:hypothetical protein [Flammeovirga agarivorans]NLR91799.1 hypothetical protein [Flammeovirga agarivorans]
MTLTKKILLITIVSLCSLFQAEAQSVEQKKDYDNQFFFGNKLIWGNEKWRYSGELQARFTGDMQQFDRYFMEGVATYLFSKNFEIVPDFRFSVLPNEVELRPGLGIIYKVLGKNKTTQFVQQIKWQGDYSWDIDFQNGLRYVLFFNKVFHEKYVGSIVGGAFYRWSEQFNGIQFLRFGVTGAYLIDAKHTLNLSYFYGALQSNDQTWSNAGTLLLQLNIRFNKEYRYVPAKYINF